MTGWQPLCIETSQESKFHWRGFCGCPRLNINIQCCFPGLSLFYSRLIFLFFTSLLFLFTFLSAGKPHSEQVPVSNRHIWYHSNCFPWSVEFQESGAPCWQFLGLSKFSIFLIDASYNSITYGNMQKINKPDDTCIDPDETKALPSCIEHVSISCGELHLQGHMETSFINRELVARSWEDCPFQDKWLLFPSCSKDNRFFCKIRHFQRLRCLWIS